MLTHDRVLSGRYQVGAEIGRGGMARVYLGTDAVLGRPVAVKVLHPEHAADPSFVDRFRREARSAARLNHPNVVSVFDTGSDGAVHFIVMEHVRGRTLAQVMAEEGPLPPGGAAEIARSVAVALSFAHAEGLVHRDVKPANVMLTEGGRVKVMDFGIARVTSSATLTQTATVLGTAAYLSPEQAQGLPVDGRSDVYALGVVLYEMLTGRAPFAAESPVAVAFKHVREEPPPPSVIRPGIPSGLEAVVMRALSKDPDARFASAEEMASALEPFADGDGPARTPTSSRAGAPVAGGATRPVPPDPTARLPAAELPRSRRPAPAHAAPRRRRWPVLLALSLLATVTAVVALTLAGGSEPSARRPAGGPATPAPATQRPSPSLSPSPSASPSSPAPPGTVRDGLSALATAAQAAIAAGDLGSHAADELRSGVEDSLRHYGEGDLDKALEDIGHTREQLAKDADHGDATAGTVAALDPLLAHLAAAMEASPPPAGDRHGGGDHGHGQGNGNA